MTRHRRYAILLVAGLVVLAPIALFAAAASPGGVAQVDDNETAQDNETGDDGTVGDGAGAENATDIDNETATPANETDAGVGTDNETAAGTGPENETTTSTNESEQFVDNQTLREIRSSVDRLNYWASSLEKRTDYQMDRYGFLTVLLETFDAGLNSFENVSGMDGPSTGAGPSDEGVNETATPGTETGMNETTPDNGTEADDGTNETATPGTETDAGDGTDDATAEGGGEVQQPGNATAGQDWIHDASQWRHWITSQFGSHLEYEMDNLTEYTRLVEWQHDALDNYQSELQELNETISDVENETVRERLQSVVESHNETVQRLSQNLDEQSETVHELANQTAELNSSLHSLDFTALAAGETNDSGADGIGSDGAVDNETGTNETEMPANETGMNATETPTNGMEMNETETPTSGMEMNETETPTSGMEMNETETPTNGMEMNETGDENATVADLAGVQADRMDSFHELGTQLLEQNETIERLQQELSELEALVAALENETLPDADRLGDDATGADNESMVDENTTTDNATTGTDNATAGSDNATDTDGDGNATNGGAVDAADGNSPGAEGPGFGVGAALVAAFGLAGLLHWRQR